jgi:GNAT superfamily N-acetyltransferase
VGSAGDFRIRPARREDAARLLGLIRELAEYERLADQVVGTEELLVGSLFERRVAEALLAEADGEEVGYAVFFPTFSTFECRPGLWVEDIFVRPQLRRSGIGRAILAEIAAIALDRGCARLEWMALEWNEPALRFYDGLGATRLDDWRALRLDGEALRQLGARGK